MTKFRIGTHVRFNSEAGVVSGTIIGIKTREFKLSGKDGRKYTRHATKNNPQYAIKSDKSNHIAHHFGSALRKV